MARAITVILDYTFVNVKCKCECECISGYCIYSVTVQRFFTFNNHDRNDECQSVIMTTELIVVND